MDDDDDSQPLTTTFELNDTLYVKAELEETDTVYLWLGVSYTLILRIDALISHILDLMPKANVMLSYTLDQAIELLESKHTSAKTTLGNTVEDLEFLREQITVMEVNTARCYNWDVKRRRTRAISEGEEVEAGGAHGEDNLD